MQFKNMISVALLASTVTVGMAAPLPAVPTKEVESVEQNDAANYNYFEAQNDADFEAQKKKGMENLTNYLESQTKPPPKEPPKEKPEGCLKWHMVRGAFGVCRLWEEGAQHPPDGAPTVPKGTDLKDYPPTKRDAPAKRPIGKTRTIQKEDISFREKRPAGCIRWVSRGPLLGYCGEWEDVVVREEDIPEDMDGEPPMIINQSSEIMMTQERSVGCVDWVKKGKTVGYCRKWENVEITKEDQPVEEDGSDGNRDHNLRTCTRRPDTCVDWMQVEPTKGYCTLWEEEVVEKPNVVEEPNVVEKRDVAKAKTREKSPFDIPMPFWSIGAL